MTCLLKCIGHRTQEHMFISLLKDKVKYVDKQPEEIYTGLGPGAGGIRSTGASVCVELGYIAFLVWEHSPAIWILQRFPHIVMIS